MRGERWRLRLFIIEAESEDGFECQLSMSDVDPVDGFQRGVLKQSMGMQLKCLQSVWEGSYLECDAWS